jgi:hypothetical protein
VLTKWQAEQQNKTRVGAIFFSRSKKNRLSSRLCFDLVAHEVSYEALVEGLHGWVREEVEGIVVLQQAVLAARGEVEQLAHGAQEYPRHGGAQTQERKEDAWLLENL